MTCVFKRIQNTTFKVNTYLHIPYIADHYLPSGSLIAFAGVIGGNVVLAIAYPGTPIYLWKQVMGFSSTWSLSNNELLNICPPFGRLPSGPQPEQNYY